MKLYNKTIRIGSFKIQFIWAVSCSAFACVFNKLFCVFITIWPPQKWAGKIHAHQGKNFFLFLFVSLKSKVCVIPFQQWWIRSDPLEIFNILILPFCCCCFLFQEGKNLLLINFTFLWSLFDRINDRLVEFYLLVRFSETRWTLTVHPTNISQKILKTFSLYDFDRNSKIMEIPSLQLLPTVSEPDKLFNIPPSINPWSIFMKSINFTILFIKFNDIFWGCQLLVSFQLAPKKRGTFGTWQLTNNTLQYHTVNIFQLSLHPVFIAIKVFCEVKVAEKLLTLEWTFHT